MEPRPSQNRPRSCTGGGPPSASGLRTALWAGFVGGCLAGFAKWGVEAVMPARPPGRPIPPIEVLKSFGLNADSMTYGYSGRTLNFGAAATHQAFSIAFAVLYAALAEASPALARGNGTAFGLIVTGVFHGGVLPLGRWAPPIWDLPAEELASETVSHLVWIWTIDLVRRGLIVQAT